ncbi:Transcriptional regulatory protein ZraR [compost metagenome]
MHNGHTTAETILELDDREAQPLSIRAKALVFADPASRAMLAYLERIAPSDAPVLINGETGTGKELVARHIHQLSDRKGPFIAVNCGAISEQLAESELFGHVQGAFTGATGSRSGWFEAANGGTLFLDEIGDLPLSLQVKLLRVLQEREVVRVGSRKPIPVDIRLVAATNVDLDDAVSAGRFRLDLLYRLNIVDVKLPPLRERPGDVRPLAEHFLRRYAKRLALPPQVLSEAAIQALERYPWPGNIRELENVIHHALLVSSDDEITVECLKLNRGLGDIPAGGQVVQGSGDPYRQLESALQDLFEREEEDLFGKVEGLVVRSAYEYARFNQVRSARLLSVSRTAVRTLLKKHCSLTDEGREPQALESDTGLKGMQRTG